MKRTLIILLSTYFFANSATACKLAPDTSWRWSDETLIQKTNNIVVARVIEVRIPKNKLEPTQYTLSTVDKIKGSEGVRDFVIEAYPKSGSGSDATFTKTCKLSMTLLKNSKYLVFKDAFHPKAIRMLDESEATRQWLERVKNSLHPKTEK